MCACGSGENDDGYLRAAHNLCILLPNARL
jgi:hypothetical protein